MRRAPASQTRGADIGATLDFNSATTNFGRAADQKQSPAEVEPQRLQGERIGNYGILAELGRGGMGVVFKAQDRRLGRLVAIKVILAGGHAGAIERQRFEVEVDVAAAARLQNPNIVQVYEVGEDIPPVTGRNGRRFQRRRDPAPERKSATEFFPHC